MRNRQRLYLFRRGKALTKAPDSTIRGTEDGHSERKSSDRVFSIQEKQKMKLQTLDSDASGYIGVYTSNGHFDLSEGVIDPIAGSEGFQIPPAEQPLPDPRWNAISSLRGGLEVKTNGNSGNGHRNGNNGYHK